MAAVDIHADIHQGTTVLHIMVEVVILTISISGAFILFLRLLREARESRKLVQQLTRDLEFNRQQAHAWKEENHFLLEGLGASINKQFDQWQLTDAEKEISLLLLKGLSHKEVANIRNVSEATTRQQSRSIYQKAGISGRHDLAAFFLEDLALPLSRRQQTGD